MSKHLEKIRPFDVYVIGEKAEGSEKINYIREFLPNAAQSAAGQTKSKFISVKFVEQSTNGDLFNTVDKPTSETISVWERDGMFAVLADIILAPTKDAEEKPLPVNYTLSATDKTQMKLKSQQSGALLTDKCEPSYMYDNKKGDFMKGNKRDIDKVTGKMSYKEGRSIRTSFTKFFTASELADEGYVDAAMFATKFNIEKLRVLKDTLAEEVEDKDLPPVRETVGP